MQHAERSLGTCLSQHVVIGVYTLTSICLPQPTARSYVVILLSHSLRLLLFSCFLFCLPGRRHEPISCTLLNYLQVSPAFPCSLAGLQRIQLNRSRAGQRRIERTASPLDPAGDWINGAFADRGDKGMQSIHARHICLDTSVAELR